MKKLPVIIFVAFLLVINAKAQQSQRLVNWLFLKQDLGNVWEAVRPVPEGGPESVPLWRNVTVPHCYNETDAVTPESNYYQGTAWYTTLLNVDNPYANGKTLLHLEGVGQKGEVYIYTTKVGNHVGGYDEWTVDLTTAIAEFKKTAAFTKQFKGKVPLVIRTDNSRDTEMIPSSMSDFNLYGGLYRHVNLVYVPQLSIEKLFIKSEVNLKSNKATATITPRFYNPDKINGVSATLKLYDPAGKLVLTKESAQKQPISASFWDIEINKPKLWSPTTPVLYSVEATFKTADGAIITHQEKFGFRDFQFVEQGPFLLNGRRLLLKGTHRHEDHAGVAGAMTDEMTRKEILMMKEMGVNFIRLGHYQQSKQVLNLCDSLGILVWEEIPWCRGGLGGKVYQDMGKRMLTNMIEQHYNHPSIIIWGLGNENDWSGDFLEFDQQKIRAYMKELHELSHQLDASRKTAIRRCDFCKDIVDVYSPSIWAGWYRGLYTEYKAVSANEMKGVKHFLHVEWGADSHAGRNSENPEDVAAAIKTGNGGDERAGDATFYGGDTRVSRDGDWSETYQCNLIDWHLKEQEKMSWLTGTAYWPFKDFSTPLRPENPVPYVNQKGVVERDFTPKEAYYVFQSYWTTKPMLHIYGHNWPIRWGNVNEEKMVKIYSNCTEVELWLNGKSFSKKKRNSQDFPAAGLHWNLIFNEGQNQIIAKGKKDGIIVTDTIVFEYQTKKWSNPTTIKITKKEIADGITTVHVQLVDTNGTPCLDAKNYFEFDLAGDGTLIKDLGTSTASSKVQAFNGRGAIGVKTKNGKSTLYIKSSGIKTISVEI